ncbi:MAG: Lrp/AsnC family transcriptional regulator [Actinomycetota bacterium]
MVSGYVLIQTRVGRAHEVADEIARLSGVISADGVTGPYDVIARAEARSLDDLSRLVVLRMQEVDGVTRTLTCPVVHL